MDHTHRRTILLLVAMAGIAAACATPQPRPDSAFSRLFDGGSGYAVLV